MVDVDQVLVGEVGESPAQYGVQVGLVAVAEEVFLRQAFLRRQ